MIRHPGQSASTQSDSSPAMLPRPATIAPSRRAKAVRTALVMMLALAPSATPAAPPADKSDWWSFQPAVRPALPRSHRATRVTNPIDAFIQAKLAEQNLAPSPEADRVALIRRLSFDLIGLPPSPDEVDQFLAG